MGSFCVSVLISSNQSKPDPTLEATHQQAPNLFSWSPRLVSSFFWRRQRETSCHTSSCVPGQKWFSLCPEYGLTYASSKFTTLRNMLGSLAISRREEHAAFYKTPRPAESTRGINNIKQFKQPETDKRHVAPKCLCAFNKCKAETFLTYKDVLIFFFESCLM